MIRAAGAAAVDLAYELAWLWKATPEHALSLDLDALDGWHRQHVRIMKLMEDP